MIGIVNYRVGNLASIRRMLEKAGAESTIVDRPDDLQQVDRIILAGVGAFDFGMQNLREGGWVEPLTEAAMERRVPVLGICLGMQLFCASSDEGSARGLGWIDGQVRRFRVPPGSNIRIPHMGWNTVQVARPNPLLEVTDEEQRFYFVHSYHVECADAADVVATTTHGHPVVAALAHGNVYGVQFHPEKSHRFGLALLRRFAELEPALTGAR